MSTTSAFTVQHAAKRHRPRTLLRTDLDMKLQLDVVERAQKERRAEGDWKTYLETWDTQPAHERYLRCLLGESERHIRKNFAKDDPEYIFRLAALKRLAITIPKLMHDSKEDKYVIALKEIAQLRLFS